MRQTAWDLLWKGRWLGRLFMLVLFFVLFNFAVQQLVGALFADSMEVLSARLKASSDVSEMLAVLSSPEFVRTIVFQCAFNILFGFLYSGLFFHAMAFATLRAVDGASDMKGALCAFRIPIGVWWLAFRKYFQTWWPIIAFMAFIAGRIALTGNGVSSSRIMLGILMVACPCFVQVYRYKMAWFVKVEDMEASAGRCLGESSALMHGMKWRNCMFECSYWMVITLPLVAGIVLPVIALMLQGPLGGLLMSLATGLVTVLTVFAVLYLDVGQAVFYRELKANGDSNQSPAEGRDFQPRQNP